MGRRGMVAQKPFRPSPPVAASRPEWGRVARADPLNPRVSLRLSGGTPFDPLRRSGGSWRGSPEVLSRIIQRSWMGKILCVARHGS